MAAEMDSTLPPPSEARGAVATKVDRDGLEELPLLYNDDEVVSAKTVPCRSDSVASTTSMALSPEGSDTWQEVCSICPPPPAISRIDAHLIKTRQFRFVRVAGPKHIGHRRRTG